MDPVTILSATGAVSTVVGKSWELVNWIRDLCEGVKTVDERIRRLESGVSELACACQSGLAALERARPGKPGPSRMTLILPWDEDGCSTRAIGLQVSNCQKTLKELETVLAGLRLGSSSRASRYRKLQDRGKEIDWLSARIKTHTDALQLSLQTVIIDILLATPGFVLRQLDEALHDISMRLERMEAETHRSRGRSSLNGDRQDPLIGRAQDALRRGTHEASIARSTFGGGSVMGSEKVTSIGNWIQGTGDAAQNTHGRSRLAPDLGDVCTTTTHLPVEDAVPEASSETASDAGSSSWDDSQSETLPATEEKSAPIAEPPGLRRPAMVTQVDPRRVADPSTSRVRELTVKKPPTQPTQLCDNDVGLSIDTSKPLDQWNRPDVVSRFDIKPNGRFEVKICTGTKVDPEELLCLKKSEVPGKIDGGGEREKNKLALHFAVLFQDLHWVESLVNVGYSPNLSAQASDRKPFDVLRTPIDIAIASHCEPILKALLKRAYIGNYRRSCIKLFATTSLSIWPSTDLGAYTRVLNILMAESFHAKESWQKTILHQILDLPEPWTHLREPLITFALEKHGRRLENIHSCTNYQPLHVTIQMDDVETFKHLLKTSSTQDLDSKLQLENGIEWSLLRHAIERVKSQADPSLRIVRAMLERGASLDDTSMAPSRYLGSLLWKETSIRKLAMRSRCLDLWELAGKY